MSNQMPLVLSSTAAVAQYCLRGDRNAGLGNALQSFVFDVRNRVIYAGTKTGATDAEQVIINRYDMDGPYDQASLDFMNATPLLRHQSLAIEYLKTGAVKLWSSSGSQKYMLTRFDYNAGGTPANVEYYQIEDSTNSSVWNVEITPSQKHLLAQSGSKVRVFDFQAMLALGPGDHRNTWLYEWSGDFSSQGFRCDDEFVYVVSGTGNLSLQDVDLRQYKIDGTLIEHVAGIQTGRADAAQESPGLVNEPENLFLYRRDLNSAPALAMGFAQGESGTWPGRTNKLYIPMDMTRVKSPYILPRCDEADAVISAMSGPLPMIYKQAIAELICQLKDKGIWSRLEALWLLAGNTDANSRKCFVRPGVNDLTKVGSPTFSSFWGFTGVPNTTLLQSALQISSMPKFTQNNQHMAFCNTKGDSTPDGVNFFTDLSVSNALGTNNDHFLRAFSGATPRVSVRSGVTASTNAPEQSPTSASFVLSSRDDSLGVIQTYFDGRTRFAGSISQTSTISPAGYVYLLGRRNGSGGIFEGTSRTMGFASIGASMSRQQQAVYRNLITEYMDTIKSLRTTP